MLSKSQGHFKVYNIYRPKSADLEMVPLQLKDIEQDTGSIGRVSGTWNCLSPVLFAATSLL